MPPVTCWRGISVSTVLGLAPCLPVWPHFSGAQGAVLVHRSPRSGVCVHRACAGRVIWVCTLLYTHRSDRTLWCFSEVALFPCRCATVYGLWWFPERSAVLRVHSGHAHGSLVGVTDSAQQVWTILKFQRGLWVNKEGLCIENPDAQEACICTHCYGIIWRNYLTSLLPMVSNPSAPTSGSFLYRIAYMMSSHWILGCSRSDMTLWSYSVPLLSDLRLGVSFPPPLNCPLLSEAGKLFLSITMFAVTSPADGANGWINKTSMQSRGRGRWGGEKQT